MGSGDKDAPVDGNVRFDTDAVDRYRTKAVPVAEFLPEKPALWLEGFHFFSDSDAVVVIKLWWAKEPPIGEFVKPGKITEILVPFGADAGPIGSEAAKSFVTRVREIEPSMMFDLSRTYVAAWDGDRNKPTLQPGIGLIAKACDHTASDECECPPVLDLDFIIENGQLRVPDESPIPVIPRPPIRR